LIAFRVDEAIGIGNGIESEPLPPKLNGSIQTPSEEVPANFLGRIGGEHSQGNA
jgi:hypothetical protein